MKTSNPIDDQTAAAAEQRRPPDNGHAASPCGGLAVTTTREGLPIGLRIARSQLTVSLDVVAARIVALCALAGAGSAYRRRLRLQENGTPVEVLDALGLPDRRVLLQREEDADRWCAATVRR